MDQGHYQDLSEQLRPLATSDAWACVVVGWVATVTAVAIALSLSGQLGLYVIGQGLLALSFLQWFIVLHDCGHRHFFSRSWLNSAIGHLASACCLIPYTPWCSIHAQHHIWTGWHDLDPGMQGSLPQDLPPAKRALIDFCWKYWLPLFGIAFTVQNFWNLARLRTLFPERARWHAFSVAFMALPLLCLACGFGGAFFRVWIPVFLLFLFVSDPLLLSQHVHIPLQLSRQEKVAPFKLWEQDVFTRSLLFPRWVSALVLLHFDTHVIHHYWPNMPCYRLGTVHATVRTPNEIGWWHWLRQVKRVPAHVLLFQNRQQTGFDF